MTRTTRIATTLLTLVAALSVTLSGPHAAYRARLSTDLASHLSRNTNARTRVIVSGSDQDVDALAALHHLQVVRRTAGGSVVLANSKELNELASDPSVDHLSGDAVVRNWLSVSNQATAADQVRAGYPGGLLGIGAIAAVNGKNVGVAVVDSGINTQHLALTNKVVASVSFVTGDPSTDDSFGHGTHVAGIIAGQPTNVTPLYTNGIAPGANLINVRVLGDDGSGYVTDVINGIEWVISHRTQYNIRVINLSLGHAVYEKCADDPLCQEVNKAVQQYGLVVVAAAGNYGQTADGHMILGGITSPGNSPYAITVGATNTWGTASRADDSVATFSSRGPAPIDFTVKPDLAAPGVRIVSLQANNSALPAMYPTLHVAGAGNNQYMLLSGTSMATPMVSGAAALLLQGQPGLSPAQIKLALQSGATYMTDGGLMGAGAGNANFWASRKYASSGLVVNLLNTVVGLLGVTSSGASYWDAGSLQNNLYQGTGIHLISSLLAPLAWLNPGLLNFGQLNLLGTTNPLANVVPKFLLYGAVAGWTQAQTITWGTQINDPSGQTITWGTSDDGDTITWGTGSAIPDGQ